MIISEDRYLIKIDISGDTPVMIFEIKESGNEPLYTYKVDIFN